MKRIPLWVKRFLVIVAIGLVGYGTTKITSSTPSAPRTVEVTKEATSTAITREIATKVTYVFDGDTIELSDGTRVRYIGINTPEMGDDKTKKQCFADEATAANKTLVLGKTVKLVADTSDKDIYGRLLRYVYVDGEFINDYLVRLGYARAEPIKPDIYFAGQFLVSQEAAQKAGNGMWSACAH